MATKTTTTPTFELPSFELPKFELPKFELPTFDLGALEDAAAKAKELNDKVVASTKSAGLLSLDAYEKAVAGLVDLEEKAAQASGLDAVVSATAAHTALVKDLTAAYTKVARELLA